MEFEDEQQLLLVNNKSALTANICFVNSSIQMIRNTGFIKFLQSNINNINKTDMEVCCAVVDLMSGNMNCVKSAGLIRQLVAQKSQKTYFNNQMQQDAEEFTRALIDVICLELETLDGFESVRKKHYGIERISKIFFDNLPTGTCFRCGELPSCRNEDFLFLNLLFHAHKRK